METIITKDVFKIVTSVIIQKLDSGIVPWKQPWKDLGPPRNLVTQRPYRGVNLLLLNNLGYPSNEYLTFKQVQDLGGRVKKGERANLVVLWLWVEETNIRKREDVKPLKKPLLRYYFVFNASQCKGLLDRSNANPVLRRDPIESCEEVISNMPHCPKIVHNENEAYYHPHADFINMPRHEVFETLEGYYATLFHELIHSTGHPDRLNRKELVESTKFGSENYSIEELTAEIGACYLASKTGIVQDALANTTGYIQGWLKRLKEDKRFIVYASAHAQRAVDYILNVKHEENNILPSIQSDQNEQQ